jgi:PLD-like domain
VSTFSGRSRAQPWTPQLGGEHAYRSRLGKDRSLGESRHSARQNGWLAEGSSFKSSPCADPAGRSDLLRPPEASPSAFDDSRRTQALRTPVASSPRSAAAYVLTDRAVIEALRQAAARGVKVRIWRDPGMALRVGEAEVQAQLAGRLQGIEIRPNPPGDELMHLKGYCVDHRLLRTSSASLSPSGETREDNDLVALRGASVCSGFDAKFDRAWTRS